MVALDPLQFPPIDFFGVVGFPLSISTWKGRRTLDCHAHTIKITKETCFAETGPFADLRSKVSFWEAGQFIQWRWGSLANCCKALARKEEALKSAWSLEKFGTDAAVASADKGIRSDMFWCYNRFICLVAGSLETLSAWTEGCDCHSDCQAKGYHARRRKIAEKILASASGVQAEDANVHDKQGQQPNCCLKGRRATEFATGQFELYIEELHSITREQIEHTAGSLPPDQRSILVGDWLSACEPGREFQ